MNNHELFKYIFELKATLYYKINVVKTVKLNSSLKLGRLQSYYKPSFSPIFFFLLILSNFNLTTFKVSYLMYT